jgi:hypothetical protein
VWRFFWYDDGEKECPWATWYHGQAVAVQARHDVVFKILEAREGNEWREPHAKNLGDGLIEVCFHKSVNHRLLGLFGPDRHEFTVVLPCSHKDKIYKPKAAIKTARERINEIQSGTARVRRCERPKRTDSLSR